MKADEKGTGSSGELGGRGMGVVEGWVGWDGRGMGVMGGIVE